MTNTGRAKPVEVADSNSANFSSVDMTTAQLAKAYGISERQMNNLILSCERKGYPMVPRLGERNRRYWSPQQQFWIKIQHSGALEPNPNNQSSAETELQYQFQPDPTSEDEQSEQSAQEYGLIRAEAACIEQRLIEGRNQGANLAIAEGKAKIAGYVQMRRVVDPIVNEALGQISSTTINIPIPAIPDSDQAALRQAVRRCLL